jgi:hypothetical protein
VQDRRSAFAPACVGSEHRPDRAAESSPGSERIGDRGRLVAAVHHAVGALLVPSGTIAIPGRAVEEFLEGPHIAVLEEIARLLPAEDVGRWVPPGGALILQLPHQELQKQRRLIESPSPLAVTENVGKQPVRPLSPEKVLLIRRLHIAVTRGNHHPFDAEDHHLVEEPANPQGVCIAEQGRIGGDPVASVECGLMARTATS